MLSPVLFLEQCYTSVITCKLWSPFVPPAVPTKPLGQWEVKVCVQPMSSCPPNPWLCCSLLSSACPPGWHGAGCLQRCICPGQTACDPVTGKCQCPKDGTGTSCELGRCSQSFGAPVPRVTALSPCCLTAECEDVRYRGTEPAAGRTAAAVMVQVTQTAQI